MQFTVLGCQGESAPARHPPIVSLPEHFYLFGVRAEGQS
jgi:hypothetical protein